MLRFLKWMHYSRRRWHECIGNDWRTFWEHYPHLQVAGGESDDGRFVQLWGDGRGQRQHFGQLVELAVLLLPPRPRRVLRLLLHALSLSLSRTGVSDPSAVRFTTQTQPHARGLQHGKLSETSRKCSCHRQFPAIHGGSWDVLHTDARWRELHDYDRVVSSTVSLISHTHEIHSGPESLFMREVPSIHQMREIFLENSRARDHFSETRVF